MSNSETMQILQFRRCPREWICGESPRFCFVGNCLHVTMLRNNNLQRRNNDQTNRRRSYKYWRWNCYL